MFFSSPFYLYFFILPFPTLALLSGAAPGCLLRGGGGKMSRYCCASQKICASRGKVAQRGGGGGGLRHIFFPTSKNSQNIFHNGVGVLSWPWPTAELTSNNNKKKNHRGGPSWRRHWLRLSILIQTSRWITTQDMRKKILHALHFKWVHVISIKINILTSEVH